MTGKITASFRQQKPGVLRTSGKHVKQEEKSSAEVRAGTLAPSAAGASGGEDLLIQFDLSAKYGPCIGMTRLERWERAERFGLNPPQEVRALLTRDGPEAGGKNNCLWTGRV